MKYKKYIRILVAMLIGLPLFAHAEFYKYRDESGVTRFTDDLSRVPEDQRPQADQYEEVVSSSEADVHDAYSEDALYADGDDLGEEIESGNEANTDESESVSRLEDLNNKKILLDGEYRSLMEEKAALENARDEFESQEALGAYNEKIVNLNERISDYETRRQTFSDEVDAFNAQQDTRE